MRALIAVLVASLAIVAVRAEFEGIQQSYSGLESLAPGAQPTCNCPANAPVCLLCPGNSVSPTSVGCFPANYNGYSCCGCAPIPGSCARYVPGSLNCPAPNFDSAALYPCNWNNQRSVLRYGEATVFRCANVNPSIQSLVQWNVRPNSDGEFTVVIMDQPNFELYARGQPYRCLNPNCGQAGSAPKYGSFTSYGSVGYYAVVTKTNQNFSGTSSYWMSASVSAA